jgi:hypothetical protein
LFEINKRFIFARTNLNLQTQVTAMKKGKWENFTDEDITDEIILIYHGMEALIEKNISIASKQSITDEYLDKLNSLYNEQRKRGTFKGDSGAA